MAATVSDRENRSQVQTELLLGLQKEIEAMELRLRPFSKALHIAREENPPACIAAQTAFRLPTQNSEAYVVGSDGDRRLVKIRDGEVVEERPYVEGFTLQGLLLSPREIRMAYDAIHKYHEAPTENPAITLRERMPWASEATLAAIAALPGPVVCCHLDATTANILVTTSGDSAILIDDEYQALAVIHIFIHSHKAVVTTPIN